ncbi:MAG TPA: glycine cleavage system protein GcvH [Pseudonocardiaceae bacterium]
MAIVPKDLKYSREHEWVRQRDAVAMVGITDHAQRQLGDIVYVELPKVGDRFEAGEPFGSVESVKAVTEVYAPVTGEIIKVNEGVNDSPERLNEDPYGDGWMIEIRMANATGATGLLTAAEYSDYIQEDADS